MHRDVRDAGEIGNHRSGTDHSERREQRGGDARALEQPTARTRLAVPVRAHDQPDDGARSRKRVDKSIRQDGEVERAVHDVDRGAQAARKRGRCADLSEALGVPEDVACVDQVEHVAPHPDQDEAAHDACADGGRRYATALPEQDREHRPDEQRRQLHADAHPGRRAGQHELDPRLAEQQARRGRGEGRGNQVVLCRRCLKRHEPEGCEQERAAGSRTHVEPEPPRAPYTARRIASSARYCGIAYSVAVPVAANRNRISCSATGWNSFSRSLARSRSSGRRGTAPTMPPGPGGR